MIFPAANLKGFLIFSRGSRKMTIKVTWLSVKNEIPNSRKRISYL
jgi:hypothetical protein